MNYENAKSILQKATGDQERDDAIALAMEQGMPLSEIEHYLDWLDTFVKTKVEANGIGKLEKELSQSKPGKVCSDKVVSNVDPREIDLADGSSDRVAEPDEIDS